MLKMILKKLLSNKWMIICLMLGSIIAVAMVSSIPMYSNGILQRMLTKDLESYQTSNSTYPGYYRIKSNLYYGFNEDKRVKAYSTFDKKIKSEMVKQIGLPVVDSTNDVAIQYLMINPDSAHEQNDTKKYLQLEALSGFEKHIDITNGRIYSKKADGDVIEAIVSQQAMKELDLKLDTVYSLSDYVGRNVSGPINVKIVGVYNEKNSNEPYWFQAYSDFRDSFIMDYDLLRSRFIDTNTSYITRSDWFVAFNYLKVNLDNLNQITNAYNEQSAYLKNFSDTEFDFPTMYIMQNYQNEAKQLKTTLWVIETPILMMLIFYIYMVAALVIEYEKNEIAVFKSRGVSNLRIFLDYLYEGLLLGLAAIIVGPPIGLLLCKIIGASSGFLEFVTRTALPVKLTLKAYLYSFVAILFFIITMLVPAMAASRKTIVEYKRESANELKTPFWKKSFIDFILLGIALYGKYSYQMRQKVLFVSGVKGSDVSVDPLLFLISAFFILGCGLLFIRIYPYLMKFIFWLGKKIWSPVFYATFIEVGRSGGRQQFIMLFLIFTLSIGIFNANSARTINQNVDDRVRYKYGADIVIKPAWSNNSAQLDTSADNPVTGISNNQSKNSTDASSQQIIYEEPSFEPYTKLAGLQNVTKVLRSDNVTVQAGEQSANKAKIMAVIPYEFGKIAWFRNDLTKYHWYNYLNLLTYDPKAVLITKSLQDSLKANVGSTIYVKWGNQNFIECTVYGIVDYWPTYNPNEISSGVKVSGMVIANFDYIQAKSATEPYETWGKMKKNATTAEVYNDISKKNINIISAESVNQQLMAKKNDPMIQGTNGALSLGFIIAMCICALGYFIYWIISIKSRTVQFGILRAMGLSGKSVTGMIVLEQLFISFTSIVMGIVIGGITSDIYVPMFELTYSADQQVPPFRVVAAASDYLKIYLIVIIIMAVAFIILKMFISNIKIHQAIKLGED